MTHPATSSDVKLFAEQFASVLGTLVIGQPEAINHLTAALLCNGHVLLSGGAATAKGLLVQGVAAITGLEFKRIQFTPDLMPSDITGAEILESEGGAHGAQRSARFVPGPIFANLVMADEINRTPPKTQASLLEAMQERQVTTGGVSRRLPAPFFVMATKTATETDGTYPLPEAQQDRFMFNIELASLDEDDEVLVLQSEPALRLSTLTAIIDGPRLEALQAHVRLIELPDAVKREIVSITGSTRPEQESAAPIAKRYIAWGAGVRASQCLALGAKAMAAMAGRSCATPQDVRAVLHPVLRHRIGLNFHASNDHITPEHLMHELLGAAAVGEGSL
jgi:MoxR-like ATPase